MSDFGTRDSGVYVHSDDDPRKHARWILGLMGACVSVNYNDSGTRRDDSDDRRDDVEYKFRRLPEKLSDIKLKYVRQKSGGGCGSGKRFVPVSCSKKCPDCNGCYPGCGKNYEFEKINDFFLLPETWSSLWNQFYENPRIKYIIRSYPVH